MEDGGDFCCERRCLQAQLVITLQWCNRAWPLRDIDFCTSLGEGESSLKDSPDHQPMVASTKLLSIRSLSTARRRALTTEHDSIQFHSVKKVCTMPNQFYQRYA